MPKLLYDGGDDFIPDDGAGSFCLRKWKENWFRNRLDIFFS